MELTGQSRDYFALFQGPIHSMNDLKDVAKSSKDLHLLQSSHVFSVMIEFWKGNFIAAEKYSNLASMMLPAAKMPTIYLIYHTFFRGLVVFQQYRQHGGDERFKNGKETMDNMKQWASNSMDVFKNKLLLLRAGPYMRSLCIVFGFECFTSLIVLSRRYGPCLLSSIEYYASIDEYAQAIQNYEGSIESAKDHGNLHEAGLAYNLMGTFYLEREQRTKANDCFGKACVYFTQWGAVAVAKRLRKKHLLVDDLLVDDNTKMVSIKRGRD